MKMIKNNHKQKIRVGINKWENLFHHNKNNKNNSNNNKK